MFIFLPLHRRGIGNFRAEPLMVARCPLCILITANADPAS